MKKKYLIFITIILNSCVSSLFLNDEQKEIETEFMKQNHSAVENLSVKYLSQFPNDKLVNHYLGRSLYLSNKADDSVIYLKKAIELDNDSSWISAWSYLFLGDYYLDKNETLLSREMYDKVILLNKTKNSVIRAKQHIFELTDFRKDFKQYSTKHINFYFEKPKSIDDINKYINDREEAFLSICNELKVNLDFKIDFFVWDNTDEIYEKYGVNLGFSISDKNIIHSHKLQTIGHEMTHVIVHKLYSKNGIKTGLINEGIAVYYDHNNLYPIEERLKNISTENKKNVSIKDLWSNWGRQHSKLTYPISGGFIKYLIDKEGINKMILLLKNQSYLNAKDIYGNEIDKLIIEYEELIRTI